MANLFQKRFYEQLYCKIAFNYVEKVFFSCLKHDKVFQDIANKISDDIVFKITDIRGISSFAICKSGDKFYRRDGDNLVQADLEVTFKSINDLIGVLKGKYLFGDACVEGKAIINGDLRQINYVTQCMERILYFKFSIPTVKRLYGSVPDSSLAAKVHTHLFGGREQ